MMNYIECKPSDESPSHTGADTMESVRMTLADFFADNDPFTSCPSVCDAETQAHITAFLQRRTPRTDELI